MRICVVLYNEKCFSNDIKCFIFNYIIFATIFIQGSWTRLIIKTGSKATSDNSVVVNSPNNLVSELAVRSVWELEKKKSQSSLKKKPQSSSFIFHLVSLSIVVLILRILFFLLFFKNVLCNKTGRKRYIPAKECKENRKKYCWI